MAFIQNRVNPIEKLEYSKLFKNGERPESVKQAMQWAGLDYKIEAAEDGYMLNGKFTPSGNRRILQVKNGQVIGDMGSASDNWSPLDNLEIAEYFEKVNEKYPLIGIGNLKGAGMWMAFKGDDFDIIANGKADQQSNTLMFIDMKRPGTATQFVASPVRMHCQNQKFMVLKKANFAIKIQHITGNGAIIEYMTELVAGIKGRQTAVQEALQNMANLKISKKQVEQVRDMAYPLPSTPRLSEFSLDSNGELSGVAAKMEQVKNFEPVKTAIEKSEKGFADKKARALRLQDNFMTSFESYATEYGRTAYSALEAVSETNLWSDNSRGDIVGDTLTGERFHVMERVGNFLVDMIASN